MIILKPLQRDGPVKTTIERWFYQTHCKDMILLKPLQKNGSAKASKERWPLNPWEMVLSKP
jgi:hypothetical protein